MLPAILGAGQTIHAIAGRDASKLAGFQRDFSVPFAYPDPQCVLRDPEIDAVYIPLPNSMHAAWTVRALEAGKRVLCEKPVALNLAEVERVIAAARSGILLENFSYQIPENAGALTAIETRFSFLATDEHRSRFDASLGGGSFLDLGCYGVDFAHRLLDADLEILDVQATRRGNVDEACRVRALCGAVSVVIESSFTAPPRQEFLLRYAGGAERRIERSDDTIRLLRHFGSMTQSDPADLIRWRRNAAVCQQVLRRMQY